MSTSAISHQGSIDRTPWLNISLRCLLAGPGGYAVASIIGMLIAKTFPMTSADATMSALMLGFIVQLLAVIYAFQARTIMRATLGLAVPSAIAGLMLWLLPVGGVA
ncbi:hypothetical protein KDN34_01770 [Shewanella yunxiaonensis]|uniref:Iron transporter n=1 Tax=Shewanella yunxiaonensis TaxID=2829809 RepID=A0ABX7YTW7_9GAMM|nr:hypothetical protein [Shewanella yunxiaonensis]QUN06225.1 hypothetical protein KDN34_01770 [Shewanella yunxiaonensis]